MRQKTRTIGYLCALIIGLAYSGVGGVATTLVATMGIIVICAALLYWRKERVRFFFLCVFLLSVGLLRVATTQERIGEGHIGLLAGSDVRFTGTVADEPDVRADHQKITLGDIVAHGERQRGKVLIKAGFYPELAYSDVVRLRCALARPEPIEDFAYDRYLERFGIYAVCWQPRDMSIVGHDEGGRVLGELLRVKKRLLGTVDVLYPEPQSALLAGLLVGAKRSLPEDVQDNFRRTGLTHIVALSGYNISIIVSVFFNVGIYLGCTRKWVSALLVAGLALFVLLVGAQSSIIRAAIMGVVIVVVKNNGRLARPTVPLLLSAAAMLFINPRILFADVGFQLSFTATAGLLFFAHRVARALHWMPRRMGIREAATATVSATLFSLPVMLYHFQALSLVSVFANMLVLPVIPLAMGVGFMSVLVGIVLPTVALPIAWLAYLLLSFILSTTALFATLPWAYLTFEKNTWQWAGAIAVGVGFFVFLVLHWRGKQKTPTRGGRLAH